MIFIGDVAIAPGDRFRHVGFPGNFQVKPICLSLEGAISPQDEPPAHGLCNSLNCLDPSKISHWDQFFLVITTLRISQMEYQSRKRTSLKINYNSSVPDVPRLMLSLLLLRQTSSALVLAGLSFSVCLLHQRDPE